MSVPVLSNAKARHLFLEKHRLSCRPSGTGKGADLKGVLDELGFVQLDSVNTFARAHDLILWSRKQQYRPDALQHLLHRDRQVFEHWTHDAAIIPMNSFAHWRLRFDRDATRLASHWKDARRGDLHAKIDEVLKRISDHGACTSGQVGEGESRGSSGWWDWHPSKTALEFLWRSGQLSVLRRDGFTKVYDLTERVIPPEHLNRRHHPQETIDWCCNGAMDRLGFATSRELAAFWDHVTSAEAKDWCAAALSDGQIIEVDIEGVDGALRRSFARPDIMDVNVAAPAPRIRVLSPFDPALRDRKRAERLFGFNYRIEIFVPEPKRKYGYYVFPVIEGDHMIGRIDMRRTDGALVVRAFWPESGVKMGVGRLKALQAELERAAAFGGCSAVSYDDGWVR
ncbi:crosslink repair DNA glycosylase YcaQ family protein [Yoonia sp.]|uniref:winged helix-turn-helix domain-containing protein n=1 Tax=Yoonia sp. TaxID=2212373 RepID=UPI0025EC7561|nr:crosslink repair DNA glycosylase YcaQ family protein [Yoonia sp.]